jgi:hypothetical protein
VGVIQRQIEAAGVATTSISLVRRFTELVRPPRALWVPFPFGRPLGAPNNARVQRLVLLSVLGLLKRSNGPVLEDLVLPQEFDHLDARYQASGSKCGPTSCDFGAILGSGGGERLGQKAYDCRFEPIREEIGRLTALHTQYRERYRRTQVSASRLGSEAMIDAAEAVHRFVCVEMPESKCCGIAERRFIRSAIDDLKAFYVESRIAEDDGTIENAASINDWLWLDTHMSSLLVAARDRLIEVTDTSEDPNWILARGIVPRGYGKSGYTMTHILGRS